MKNVEKLITLNENEALKFGEYIKKQRKVYIDNPNILFNKIDKNNAQRHIKNKNLTTCIQELREQIYADFLKQEANFNSIVFKDLSLKFKIPCDIFQTMAKSFYDEDLAKFDTFLEKLRFYFGEYSGAISPYIYALALSNTNSRRSRAGKDFENIIYFLYENLGFKYESQAKIGKNAFSSLNLGKVVDSVLPSIKAFESFRNKTIVGSMKTTLRERWQEVVEEVARSNLPNIYLLTCDTNISKNKIQQMAKHNIILVVYKDIKENLQEFKNVIAYETYFYNEIPLIMDYWNDKNY